MNRASNIDLPEELCTWVETATQGAVVWSTPHHAGASRSAWQVDVELAEKGTSIPLFLLQDKRGGGGSMRDAAVLRALTDTEIPVPTVVAADEERAAILQARLPGRADFPAVDEIWERELTAAHLMALTAKLHALDPGSLSISHLALPEAPEDCARGTLAQARGAVAALGASADPFFGFALDWLEARVPSQVNRYALVHSDMGPGNFLYEKGRITGIVDWEVAHFGDPMEDLAAISVRDMATPVGSLAKRFEEYAANSDVPVDLARVHYYRALVLVRNCLMIGLGLAHPSKQMDLAEMTMYQTLLVRAAALVLCDNLGIARPDVPHPTGDATAVEREEVAAILDLSISSLPDVESIDSALRNSLTNDAVKEAEFATFFARRMHRLASLRASLLGPLYERLPQPLVAS